jgi:hypothetical protein
MENTNIKNQEPEILEIPEISDYEKLGVYLNEDGELVI